MSDIKLLIKQLSANPFVQVILHPDPRALGVRRYLESRPDGLLVFVRPNPDYPGPGEPELITTFMRTDQPFSRTERGWTVLDGRIEFIWR